GPGAARDFGDQEADQRARGYDPRISDRRARHHRRRAGHRLPGRAARGADADRRNGRPAGADRRVIPHLSERAVVLAPQGRDAAVACAMLGEAAIRCETATGLPAFIAMLSAGAGFGVITEEAL